MRPDDPSAISPGLTDARARLAGRRVLVMGLGRFGGGIGVTRFLAQAGAIVTVTDRADEASRRYLVGAGIPDGAILDEDEGRTTFESLENVARLLGAGGDDEPDVVVVTDPYHAKRAELTAGEVGLDADAATTPDSVVRGWSSVRRHVMEGAGVAVGRLIGFDALSDLTD